MHSHIFPCPYLTVATGAEYLHRVFFCEECAVRWTPADAENEVSSAESPELSKVFSLKPEVGQNRAACSAYCQKFYCFNHSLLISFRFFFFSSKSIGIIKWHVSHLNQTCNCDL